MIPNSTLQASDTPVGTIIAFAGNIQSYPSSPPEAPGYTTPEPFGWMLCDGRPLKVVEYPELYMALGTLYGGSGQGEDQTFNLPDLRGQFLRGVGTSEGSTENRTAPPGGTGTADGVGSTQKDALQTHQHMYSQPTQAASGSQGTGFTLDNPSAYTGGPASQDPGASVNVSNYETRPVNTFVNYLIKYTFGMPAYTNLSFKP